MGQASRLKEERRFWRMLSLVEQADVAERHQLETLFYCPDRWAMRPGSPSHRSPSSHLRPPSHRGPRAMAARSAPPSYASPSKALRASTSGGRSIFPSANTLDPHLQSA